jgi:hypothetical protein
MNVTNQNQEIDTFRIIKNDDGSFSAEWDRNDPKWAFLNGLTGSEIQVILKQAIEDFENDN